MDELSSEMKRLLTAKENRRRQLAHAPFPAKIAALNLPASDGRTHRAPTGPDGETMDSSRPVGDTDASQKTVTLKRTLITAGPNQKRSNSEAFNEICPKSQKLANESKTFQDPLPGVYGSLVNNNSAFVTLKSFDGQ